MAKHPYQAEISAVPDGVQIVVRDNSDDTGLFVVLGRESALNALSQIQNAISVLWPTVEID